jgi:hypothetical protein
VKTSEMKRAAKRTVKTSNATPRRNVPEKTSNLAESETFGCGVVKSRLPH